MVTLPFENWEHYRKEVSQALEMEPGRPDTEREFVKVLVDLEIPKVLLKDYNETAAKLDVSLGALIGMLSITGSMYLTKSQ